MLLGFGGGLALGQGEHGVLDAGSRDLFGDAHAYNGRAQSGDLGCGCAGDTGQRPDAGHDVRDGLGRRVAVVAQVVDLIGEGADLRLRHGEGGAPGGHLAAGVFRRDAKGDGHLPRVISETLQLGSRDLGLTSGRNNLCDPFRR